MNGDSRKFITVEHLPTYHGNGVRLQLATYGSQESGAFAWNQQVQAVDISRNHEIPTFVKRFWFHAMFHGNASGAGARRVSKEILRLRQVPSQQTPTAIGPPAIADAGAQQEIRHG